VLVVLLLVLRFVVAAAIVSVCFVVSAVGVDCICDVSILLFNHCNVGNVILC